MQSSFENVKQKLLEVGITSEGGIHSDNLVVSFEQKYGFRLPQDYKKFLLTYGEMNYNHQISYSLITNIPKHNERGRMGYFYNLQNGNNDLISNIESYLGRMPESMIPFADISGGDQLCIGVTENVSGKIYFWDHDQEHFDPSEEELWNNVYLVANTFSEFILSFQIVEDENLPKDLGIVSVKTTPEFLKLVEKFKSKKQ
ncbi:SMI1/KNR4 family protein [Paenibacillus sp. LjRoot56]|uniref:SMI1/KNR4 family protein n=1 Tax=Paenibacillus sp. LjRoot56 TaxID=3342333 RepID=UPI003ECD0406